jgi:hypothetical protein
MCNNLENKEILSSEIISVIDIIMECLPEAIFGGSIGLNAVGLLNRKINDIDLFLPIETSSYKLLKGYNRDYNENEIFSETVTDIDGTLIKRTGLKINGIKVCCFQVKKEMLQHFVTEFLGRKIKIQNVNYAIQAKKLYSLKNDKHKKDLEEIQKDIDNFIN